ncbi:MAG: tetratricopeptide repeat protein [Deltaproteobacteria bacterium]|nr:tetratricopeptide repeat protein [Deltaproteobacteria bacterium]
MLQDGEGLQARATVSRGELAPRARDAFERGRQLLATNDAAAAVVALREAHGQAPDHAQIRSALGLAVALAERDFEQARSLCESAAKQEFFNPELYLNLARVYLSVGRRPEALRYLRRGQMIDPGHSAIREAIVELGMRRLPIVPFLPRRHLVNRMLGSVRSLFVDRMLGY